jgi:hypothetical protein
VAANLPRNLANEIQARLIEREYIEALFLIVLAKHGSRAESAVAESVSKCEREDDKAGVRVWRAVSERISKGTTKPH